MLMLDLQASFIHHDDTQAVGDELHCVFGCPHFSDVRAQFLGLFQDEHNPVLISQAG